jgi:hypothetical protein
MIFFGPVPVGSFRYHVENALRGHVRVPFNSGWARGLMCSGALLPHQRHTLDETLTARALAHGFTDLPRDSNTLVDGITIKGTIVMIRGPVGPPQATVSLWRLSSLLRCYSGPRIRLRVIETSAPVLGSALAVPSHMELCNAPP